MATGLERSLVWELRYSSETLAPAWWPRFHLLSDLRKGHFLAIPLFEGW